MNTEPARQSLVVVALDASDREEYVIDIARALARSDSPELLGVFVENAELLAHAGSRLAREILLSGSERVLEKRVLERQLRSQATRARAAFEAASARFGLRHRFEVARGDIFAESVKRAAAAEALVVNLARAVAGRASLTELTRQLASHRPPVVLLARQGWLTGQSVAVLVDEHSAANDATLLAAARVAAQTGSPITALVPATSAVGPRECREQIASVLEGHGAEASNIIQLGGSDVAAMVRAARACRARLLVLPSPSDATESENAIDELLRRFSGALMLVRP